MGLIWNIPELSLTLESLSTDMLLKLAINKHNLKTHHTISQLISTKLFIQTLSQMIIFRPHVLDPTCLPRASSYVSNQLLSRFYTVCILTCNLHRNIIVIYIYQEFGTTLFSRGHKGFKQCFVRLRVCQADLWFIY